VGPDVAAHTDGVAEVDEAATLLDVQLDEGADPGERLVVAPERAGVAPGSSHRLGHRGAVTVGQATGSVRTEDAGDDARARAGDPEAGALLVDEVHRADGAGRGEAGRPQVVDGREGADDAERAVERAAVWNRVQV
jgi:hypothetical protein